MLYRESDDYNPLLLNVGDAFYMDDENEADLAFVVFKMPYQQIYDAAPEDGDDVIIVQRHSPTIGTYFQSLGSGDWDGCSSQAPTIEMLLALELMRAKQARFVL